MENAGDIVQVGCVGLVTYLAHSTILLSAAWLYAQLGRAKDMTVISAIWKSAATLGLVTSAVATLVDYSPMTVELSVSREVAALPPPVLRQPSPAMHVPSESIAVDREPSTNSRPPRIAPKPDSPRRLSPARQTTNLTQVCRRQQ